MKAAAAREKEEEQDSSARCHRLHGVVVVLSVAAMVVLSAIFVACHLFARLRHCSDVLFFEEEPGRTKAAGSSKIKCITQKRC